MNASSQGRRNELGDFLKSRRAAITPEQVNIHAIGHTRRVPGLRREEVAELASISTEYYTRLEQGRVPGASPSTLDAIARALRLDSDQVRYLYQVADKQAAEPVLRNRPAQMVRPQTQRLLENLHDTPAMVLGRHMDVLAWNTLATLLYVDFAALPPTERNLLLLTFLDPRVRNLYEDWETAARECVAFVRMDAATMPTAPDLQALVEHLAAHDRDFSHWWASHDVAHKTFGTKRYRHPVSGDLTLDWQILTLPHDPGQSLMVLTAPDRTSRHSLGLLVATQAEQHVQ